MHDVFHFKSLSFLLQDISISVIFALLYFCLGIFMAVSADDWEHQKISSAEILTIHNSLAAASVSYWGGPERAPHAVCMFACLLAWTDHLP